MLDLTAFEKYLNTSTGFNRHNGLVFRVPEPGVCECSVDLTGDSLNPQKVVHGSLLFALCDGATGVAAASLEREMLTQSANIHFLRTADHGCVTARSRAVKIGRRTALFAAEVYDDKGRLLATGDFDIFFVDNPFTWGENRHSLRSE